MHKPSHKHGMGMGQTVVPMCFPGCGYKQGPKCTFEWCFCGHGSVYWCVCLCICVSKGVLVAVCECVALSVWVFVSVSVYMKE